MTSIDLSGLAGLTKVKRGQGGEQVKQNPDVGIVVATDGLVNLPVKSLTPGKYQPRKNFDADALAELSASIQDVGVMQPLTVRKLAEGTYEILAGERRWRASEMGGLESVPCIIKEVTDQQACVLALIENIQREDLDWREEALALLRLKEEFELTNVEVAEAIGKSDSEVGRLLNLLNMPEPLQELFDRGVTAQDTLTELSIAYKANPNKVEEIIAKKDYITSREARQIKAECTGKGSDKKDKKDGNSEKSRRRDLPKLRVQYKKKGAFLVIDEVPDKEGFGYIVYESADGLKNVTDKKELVRLSDLSLVTLL